MTGRAASGGDFDEADFRGNNGIIHLTADLKNALDGFFDIFYGFFFGLALGDAAGQGGTLGHDVAIFPGSKSHNKLFHATTLFRTGYTNGANPAT